MVLLLIFLSKDAAFTPSSSRINHHHRPISSTLPSSSTTTESPGITAVDDRTGKRTGVSFLPEETIGRVKDGSPIEKIKMEKDGTSAFVDVYEYAQKIRNGEMTWEDVEKADLDTVCIP